MKKIKINNEQQHIPIICLRLTDIELSVLEDWTEKCRMTRLNFIRNVILNRKLTRKYQIVIDSEEVKLLLTQYRKIGSNLDQIARHFNSGGERSLAMREAIERAIAELYALWKEVLRLAGDYSGSYPL